MAFETPDAAGNWPAAPQFTATAETAIRIINRWPARLYYITTSSDAVPTLDVEAADYVDGTDRDDLILAAGARVWCAFAKKTAARPITLHIAEA